jgi:hypothetical protein
MMDVTEDAIMEHLLTRHFLSALIVTGLMACNNGKDTDDTDTDDTDATPDICESGIASTFPDADATGVFYRTPIEIVFNDDESTTSTLTLAAGGTDVPGTTTYSEDGATAYFTPTDDLAASTQYTLTIAYSCDKVAEIVFTTSDAGTPINGPSSLEGNVYNIDIASGRITEPPGVGQLLMPLIEEQDFFILISPVKYSGGANTLTFLGALGVDDGAGNIVQDMCTESISFPVAADFSDNPFMEISGEDVPITVQDFTITLQRIDLSGAFSPDASSIEGLSLSGFADTSGLGALLDLGDEPDAVCGLVTTFGVTCVDCGDGSVTCLELAIDSMTAEQQTGTLELIEADDIDAEACGE